MVEPIVIRGKAFEPDEGSHEPNGQACIMEMVSYLADERWSDRPKCASPVIGAFARTFWDRTPKTWPGLIERIDRLAGSASTPDVERARGYLAADWAVHRFAPRWLRRVGLDDDAKALEQLPPVVDAKSARAAYDAGHGIRGRAWQRRAAALERLRWAAGAAGAAGAAELKGKTYSQKVAWFRAKLDEVLKDEVEASIADGFALLDAMLELAPVAAPVCA